MNSYRLVNLGRCDIKERLPDAVSEVEYRGTDGVFRGGVLGTDGLPNVGDLLRAV